MTTFMCHNCKRTFEKTGMCPDCGAALERQCPVCGAEIDMCTCTSDIPQTKGPGRH